MTTSKLLALTLKGSYAPCHSSSAIGASPQISAHMSFSYSVNKKDLLHRVFVARWPNLSKKVKNLSTMCSVVTGEMRQRVNLLAKPSGTSQRGVRRTILALQGPMDAMLKWHSNRSVW